MKQLFKRCLFPGGERPRQVRIGPARGLSFIIDPASKSQRLLGLDEREIAPTLAGFIDAAATFVDIGASDGYYTIIAAKRNPRLVSIGCEAEASFAERLQEHLRINGLAGSDRVRWHAGMVGTGHRTLDAVVGDAAGPVVIKIDVDGGEADVLDSGSGVIARPDARFVIETHSAELEQGCRDRLEAAGYRCRIIEKAWWRSFIPEERPIAHNRWLVAER